MITPKSYNSLHRPIRFGIDYSQTWAWIYSSVTDNNGLAQFTSGFNPYGVPPCKFIYITSGIYEGLHVVKNIDNSGNILTHTSYIGTDSGTIWILVNLQFQVICGNYSTGLVNTINIRPFWKMDGTLTSNIADFLCSKLPSPIPAPTAGYDENLYLWFKIKIVASPDFGAFLTDNALNHDATILSMTGYDFTQKTWVGLNSSILTSELIANHIQPNDYLAPMPPIFFAGHKTIYSQVTTSKRVINVII